MLSHLSSAKRLLLALLFSLVALVIILVNTYEAVAKRVANYYLADYNTQITHLNIRPTSMHHWHIPELKLTVHGSEVRLNDLALTLDTDVSLFDLYSQQLSNSQVMSWIELISVKAINVKLNPGVLTDEGKNVDEQGPTVALDLNALPQIDIGTTSLSLAGISPSELSLTMEHLTLGEDGNLSTAISRKGQLIFQLDAHLTENQWRVSSRLVFDELYTLLTQLSSQELDSSALAPLLTLKQESERAGLKLSGTLDSSATLDLKSAQLASSHIIKQSSLTLNHFEGLTLTPHLFNSSNEESSTQDKLKFDIAGHLADLTLTIQPFTLEVNPSNHQVNSLLPLIYNEQVAPLIKTILEPRAADVASRISTDDASDMDQGTVDKPQAIKISLTLSEPLAYSFSTKKIALSHAQLNIHDAMVDAQLSASDLSLQIPTPNQAFEFESEWQFSATREQALLLSSLIPNELSSGTDHVSDRPADNKLTTDIRLGASSVSLAGNINIATETDHESSHIKLSIKPELEAKIASVELVTSRVKQGAGRPPESLSPLKFELRELKLVSNDELVMTSNQTSPLNLAVPRVTLSVGPTHYKQGIATHLPSAAKALSFDANSLAFNTKIMSHISIKKHLVDEDLISNKHAAKGYRKFILSPFTLVSTDAEFHQNNSSGESITLSTGETRLTSQDRLVMEQMTHATDTQQLEIAIPALSFEQLDNKLAFKPLPTAESSEYLGKLSGLYLSLEKPSSLTLSDFTAQSVSQVLTKNQWHNLAHYELNGVELTQHYLKNNRKRTKKLLELYSASLSQSLNWSGTKLDTHENWAFDGLEFVSEHRLQPQVTAAGTDKSGVNRSGLKLTGSLDLESKLGDILAVVSNSYSLPTSLFITGDTRLKASYELNKSESSTQMNINFEPALTSLSGSINDLPFEQAGVQASCHFQTTKFNLSSNFKPVDSNISTLACPEIQFSVAAFNPGVLITDIKAEADFSLSHDDKLAAQHADINNPAVGNSSVIPNTLSAASIQMNARGDLLGGELLLPEFNLRLHDRSHGYLVLQGLELEQLLTLQPQVGVYADGIFDGVLPVDLIEGKVSVSGGRLAARAPGGLISVSGNPAVDQMRLSQPYLDFAFSTLEHLQYSELASSFDMDTKGDAVLKVNVKGQAKGIERPIHLNYSQEENMLQLLKSLQIGDKLQTQIEQSMN